MKKLFQTLCVLLTLSSQADAGTTKLDRYIDSAKLLPFSQENQLKSERQDLADLYRIKAFQAEQIKQPYSEFELLYKNAVAGQLELENITGQIALQSSTRSLSSGIKSKSRARDKINNDLGGNCAQITDLARTSVVAEDVASLVNTFALFDRQTQVVRVKNRFTQPGASGYRDLSLLVRLPETKIIAEVQLHLAAFSTIKNGKEHDNYQQIQQIERLQVSDNRPLSEIELAAIDKLRKESQQLYQQAWTQYLSA